MYDIVFFSFHLCPENLVAKTGQFVSQFGKGWERVDREGKGGVSCGIITIFIYIFTILYGGRFERCRFVALYFVVFIMVSVSTNIFLCFFCACLLCLFKGGPCCIFT